MKKIGLMITFFAFLMVFQGCDKKTYQLADSPVVSFKTSMGEFKIKFYKDAAPKATELFVKFVKEGTYEGTTVDEVIFPNYVMNIGNNSKVFDPSVKVSFKDEVIPEDKKIQKSELLFDPKNEGFGFFSIYTGPSAIDPEEPLVVFGKVVEGEEVLSKIMEVRVDQDFKPLEPVKIQTTKVVPK
jgi:cyclophilin family peptidyl-prolyl cis-trans isomerase